MANLLKQLRSSDGCLSKRSVFSFTRLGSEKEGNGEAKPFVHPHAHLLRFTTHVVVSKRPVCRY